MKIALHDSDYTGFPNYALMKISAAIFFNSPESVMDWYLEKAQDVQKKAEGQIDYAEVLKGMEVEYGVE